MLVKIINIMLVFVIPYLLGGFVFKYASTEHTIKSPSFIDKYLMGFITIPFIILLLNAIKLTYLYIITE